MLLAATGSLPIPPPAGSPPHELPSGTHSTLGQTMWLAAAASVSASAAAVAASAAAGHANDANVGSAVLAYADAASAKEAEGSDCIDPVAHTDVNVDSALLDHADAAAGSAAAAHVNDANVGSAMPVHADAASDASPHISCATSPASSPAVSRISYASPQPVSPTSSATPYASPSYAASSTASPLSPLARLRVAAVAPGGVSRAAVPSALSSEGAEDANQELKHAALRTVSCAAVPSAPSSEDAEDTNQRPTRDRVDAASVPDDSPFFPSVCSLPTGDALTAQETAAAARVAAARAASFPSDAADSLNGSSVYSRPGSATLSAAQRAEAATAASSGSGSGSGSDCESALQLSKPAEQPSWRERAASATATVAADFDIGAWDFGAAFSQQGPEPEESNEPNERNEVAAASLPRGTPPTAENDFAADHDASRSIDSRSPEESAPHFPHISPPAAQSPEESRDGSAASAAADDEADQKLTHRLSTSADSLDLYGPTPKVAKMAPSAQLHDAILEYTAGSQERQLAQPRREVHHASDAAAATAGDADVDSASGKEPCQLASDKEPSKPAQPPWSLYHAANAVAVAQNADEDADMDSAAGKDPPQQAQPRWELHQAADAAAAVEESDESSLKTSDDAASTRSDGQAKVLHRLITVSQNKQGNSKLLCIESKRH